MVRARNRNRGQKRSFKERQEDNTFNRFEILDDLSQQEVNPSLVNLDQGMVGLTQEDPVLDSPMNPLGEECQQLVVDQHKGCSEVQEPLAIISMGGVDSLAIGQNNGSNSAAKPKPPPKLGIMQKDIKKGGADKFVKPSRKKYMEKIKLAGENLVELGAVKPLDSIFFRPLEMIVISWNVRGLNNGPRQKVVHELIRRQGPDVIFL